MTVLSDLQRPYPLNLYRHCDGYPACAGLALAEVLGKSKNATQAAGRLLRLLYDGKTYGDPHIYEFADWGPQDQGDLEHVYEVHQTVAGARADRSQAPLAEDIEQGWEIVHKWRIGWGENESWGRARMSLADFLAYCQKEAQDMERRAAAMRR